MTVEKNIDDRKAAEELHAAIGELFGDAIEKLPSDESRTIFFTMVLQTAEKNLPELMAKREKATNLVKQVLQEAEFDNSVHYALSLVEEINDMASEVEWPDAPDVQNKANDIATVIQEFNRATAGQLQALENMRNGMAKWVHD